MLAACSEPPEGTEEGYFTISLSANENTRAVFPPTSSNDLRFSVKFKNTASGAEKTFTSDRSGSMKGKIGVGNYIVTMDISLISDGSPYARGIAYDNPVAIGSGQNPIKVYAFDVNNAAPPVISAKPQGVAYTTGATAKPLTVAASVNDNGGLSYQWYSNTTNSITGGTAIGSATSPSYTPFASKPGTTWYYVVVKNTSAGKPTTINTVPVSIVNSGTGGGSGSEADPFLVYDVSSLQKVGSGTDGWTLDAHYMQTADIDLASVSNWTPIGEEKSPFTGSYDGNGKTISNLKINAQTESIQGLFGYIDSGAVVKNVGLVNCTIVGSSAVGGVVGYNGNGTVQNCYVIGNLSVYSVDDYGFAGGVVGYNSRGSVQDCYATGSVSAYSVNSSGFAGGVAGYNRGTIQNCYATGKVLCDCYNSYVGGVVAYNMGTLQSCYATGSVSGNSTIDYTLVGGVVGYNSGTVQYCYATGDVSSSLVGGGVVGWNLGNAKVQYCYATGIVSSKREAGGVIGDNIGTVQNCVALNPEVSSTNTGTVIGRVLGHLGTDDTIILANNYGRNDMKKNGSNPSPAWTSDLNDKDGASITSANWGSQSWWTTASNWTTARWDFTSVWEWSSNNLPILRNMPGTATQNPVVSGTGGSGGTEPQPGPGTATNPFLVNNVASLQKVGSGIDGWTLDAHYKQTEDIDLASVSNWTPIGGFTGSYDGNGKIISNLTINTSTDDFQGLFASINAAMVKNVGLVNCTIVASSAVGVGGVAGWNQGTVQNCYVTGNVTGYNYVGGVVGWNHGMVQNCYATSDVSGNNSVGGVVGGNSGTVQNCYATCNVSGWWGVGGVVGGTNSGTIRNCYATGDVSPAANAESGVVGFVRYTTTIQNCVALNPNVSGGAFIGRVLGWLADDDTTPTLPTLANNYGRSDMQKNGSSTTWTNIGLNDLDGADVSAGQYNSQSWWTTAGNWDTAGWDFTNIWQWGSNNLPILRNMPGTATQNPVVK
jgi:hypothetical protein